LPLDLRGVWTEMPGSASIGMAADEHKQPWRDAQRGLGDPRNAGSPAFGRPMFLAPQVLPDRVPDQGGVNARP
jgi:hypothetical protein